jgi:hypothetical protein
VIVEVLPNATHIDALLAMSKDDIDEFVEDKILPSFRRLGVAEAV